LSITRDELVRRLAEVSHLSYVRQKHRDHGVPLADLSLGVTDHDRERAEDVVRELERLGVYGESVSGRQAADREGPDPSESAASPRMRWKRQPPTDLWGNPITKR
jgi:hypothetical protein